ncbi:hypothetical protein O181_095420 [Austropuccinia psidii MF-1]|uniref:Uncharacterized protein n=1 Tax=Austropuccinia psidii MF-1 TaxID=1389203 RepID=A0A9Q3J3S4_9BASI|nr:hypothetical protein [Austropuccinia psidii MF-1]
MSYSEKEALTQLSEASSRPKFSGTGEYDNMEHIDHIDGLFIDVPRISDYGISSKLHTAFTGHGSIWYTEMKKIYCGRFKSFKSPEIVLGYSKIPCHFKLTNTLWTKIHISGVSESLKDLKPLILK